MLVTERVKKSQLSSDKTWIRLTRDVVHFLEVQISLHHKQFCNLTKRLEEGRSSQVIS